MTKDWKLKLKPPTNLDGYVESPQVYKIKALKQDSDQNTADFLHQRNNDQGMATGGLSSEGLSSEEAEGLPSFHQSDMQFIPSTPARPLSGLDSVETLLKNDQFHQGTEGTGENTRAVIQPESYDKIMEQDLRDVESALDNADVSNTGTGGLSSVTSPGIRQGVIETLGDTGRGTSGLSTAERGIISENPLDIHEGNQLSYPQGGSYVPLDNVIDDLQAEITRGDGAVGNPRNVDLGSL